MDQTRGECGFGSFREIVRVTWIVDFDFVI